jgi:hypothetical protein
MAILALHPDQPEDARNHPAQPRNTPVREANSFGATIGTPGIL